MALRFAKTPSFAMLPPPYTLMGVVASGANLGSSVIRLCSACRGSSLPASGTAFALTFSLLRPRMSRCLASPLRPSSSESSSSDGESNVSASVRSASLAKGSRSESRRLDVGDEVLDLKEGGGEEGTLEAL